MSELLSCVNDLKVQRAGYTDLRLSACPPRERQPNLCSRRLSDPLGKYGSPWDHCERACIAQEVRGSKFDPKLCPGNILTQRCPVMDRCGKKVQCYQSLGAVLLWRALSSHRVGVLCTLCCHLLEVKSFKSFSMIWESLG